MEEITNNVTEEVQTDVETTVEQKQEKTYSKEQVSEIVEKRLKREREKLEKQFTERINALEENIKLQAMSETEKANYQAQKERDAFEEERQAFYAERDAFNKAQYKSTIQKQLAEAGLPDISDTLTHLQAEEVKAQIDTMKQSFDAHVNASIEAKVKASASVPTAPTKEAQGLLTLEQIKQMSTKEVQANKELVDKSLEALWGKH